MTGVLSVSQQSSTIAGAGVAADYIVEGYDLYSTAVPVPKTYGTVSVGVSKFRGVLFTDRTAAVSLDLNPPPSVAGVGENATWSVASGQLPSGVTLLPGGTLTASTSANCQQDVLLRAQDADGNSALVLVYVNAPSPAQTFSIGVSRDLDGAQKVDLNSLPGMTLGWPETGRVWTPTPGQVLPSWMSLDASGVLAMSPESGSTNAFVLLEQNWTDTSGNPQRSVVRIQTLVADFNVSLTGDDATGAALNLAQLGVASNSGSWSVVTVPGFDTPPNWLSPAGLLSASASSYSGVIPVKVTEGESTVYGSVNVNIRNIDYRSLLPVAAAGGPEGLTVDLNQLLAVGFSGTTRRWAPAYAQQLPEGMWLSPSGILELGSIAAQQTAVIQLDQIYKNTSGSGGVSRLSLILAAPEFSADLVGRNQTSPGLSVDLKSKLPAGLDLGVNGGSWSFVSNLGVNAPSYLQLSQDGVATVQQGYGLTGNYLVKVVGNGNTVYGSLNVYSNAPSATIGVLSGETGGSVVNLNEMSGLSVTGVLSSRDWRVAPGYQLPAWLTLDPSGRLISSAPASVTQGVDVMLVQTGTDAYGTLGRTQYSVRVEPVKFQASVMGNNWNQTLAADLNLQLPANSGIQPGATWTLLSGSDYRVQLSSQGQLTLSRYNEFAQTLVVRVSDSAGHSMTGSVRVYGFSSSSAMAVSALAGQTSDLNLSDVINHPWGGVRETRTFKFLEGQNIPAWIQMDESGDLHLTPALTDAPVSLVVSHTNRNWAGDASSATATLHFVPVRFNASLVGDGWIGQQNYVDLAPLVPAEANLNTSLNWSILPLVGVNTDNLWVESTGRFNVGWYVEAQRRAIVVATDSTGI